MRLQQLIIFPIYFFTFVSCAQQDSTARKSDTLRYFYYLGTKKITVEKISYQPAEAFVFIQLHDNETTAKAATLRFIQQYGGTLLSIDNANKRYITFYENGQKLMFDPNRIFTKRGIQENLQLFKSYTPKRAAAINDFSLFILDLIPDTSLVIAVHNNTEGRYDVEWYKTDKLLRKDAAAVHINKDQDSDDFFISTDSTIYNKLVKANYNAVLQNNYTVNDDGSLSVYFGRKNSAYINVEAQSGHQEEQFNMLLKLRDIIQQYYPLYNLQ